MIYDILFTSLITVTSFILAMINLWNLKKFKHLTAENELLKFKLKECERART